jgi:hypothetical protein
MTVICRREADTSQISSLLTKVIIIFIYVSIWLQPNAIAMIPRPVYSSDGPPELANSKIPQGINISPRASIFTSQSGFLFTITTIKLCLHRISAIAAAPDLFLNNMYKLRPRTSTSSTGAKLGAVALGVITGSVMTLNEVDDVIALVTHGVDDVLQAYTYLMNPLEKQLKRSMTKKGFRKRIN